MNHRKTVEFEFVENVPPHLQNGKIYISIRFATVIHKCFCGCGSEVITPLSRAGWALTFNGETISLYPSIGNWGAPCKSHYWIKENQVIWAKRFSEQEIVNAQREDQEAYDQLYTTTSSKTDDVSSKRMSGLWARIKKWFSE